MRNYTTQYSPRSRVVYGDSNSTENRRRPSSLTRPLADVIKELGSKKSVCDISSSSRSRENTMIKDEMRRNDNVSIEDSYSGGNQLQMETNEENSSKQNTAPSTSHSKEDETVKHITKVTITPKKTRNLLSIVEGSQNEELTNEDIYKEINSSRSPEEEICKVNVEIPVINKEKHIVLPVIGEDKEQTSFTNNSNEENKSPDEANDILCLDKNEISMSDNMIKKKDDNSFNNNSKREEDVRKVDIIDKDKLIVREQLRAETEEEFCEKREEKQTPSSEKTKEVKNKQDIVSKTGTGGKVKQVQGQSQYKLSGLNKDKEKTKNDHSSQVVPSKEVNPTDTYKQSKSNLKMKKPENNRSHKRTEISKADDRGGQIRVISKRGSVSKVVLKPGPANGLQGVKDQEKDKKKRTQDFELLMQTYIKNVQEEQLFSEQVIGAISKWKESSELEESRKSYSEAMKTTKETSDLESIQSENSMATVKKTTRKHKKLYSNVKSIRSDGVVIKPCQDENSKNDIPEENINRTDSKESDNCAESSVTTNERINPLERQFSVPQENNIEDNGITNNSETQSENAVDTADVKDDGAFGNPNLLGESCSDANAVGKSQLTLEFASESENKHNKEQTTAKQDIEVHQISCNNNDDDANINDDREGDNNNRSLIHTDGVQNTQQQVIGDTQECDRKQKETDSNTVKKDALYSSNNSTDAVLESEKENPQTISNEVMEEHIGKEKRNISNTDSSSFIANGMNEEQLTNNLNETETENSNDKCMSDKNSFDSSSEKNSSSKQTGQQENATITEKRKYSSPGEGGDNITSKDIYPLKNCTPVPTFELKETKVTTNKAVKNVRSSNDQQILTRVTNWDTDDEHLPPLSKLQRQFTRLHHVPCENHVHDIEDSSHYKFGDGTLLFEENKKILQTSRVDEIIMDLYFAQKADYSMHKDRLTYQYFNTNVGFARSSAKLDVSKEFLYGRQNTIDCKFAETLKRIDLNKTRENSFFLPSPRSQCRKVKAYANLQKKLAYVLKQ
ncbi:putative uncharacterized protein DDB_G0277255 [Mytilus californianus]|uniref:putative uncharacterized protein DDB_G0277255 n=1 Tax=Mytilus californianus TaxID=6549 RepID=UPI0022472784|nr:putative uncharacterized protein DDB_G0277255 [Mytilus californianus]